MKQLAAFLLCSMSVLVNAQTCSWNVYPDAVAQEGKWINGGIRSDGGVIGVMRAQYASRFFTALRAAPDGQMVWAKPISTLDPGTLLQPRAVSVDHHNNTVIFGDLYPHIQYKNQFAVKLDSNGRIAWARIYMLDSGYQAMDNEAISFDLLDDGSYRATMSTARGVSVSKLTGQGVPVWTKRFDMHTVPFNQNMTVKTVMDPDGGLLVVGVDDNTIYAMHVDAQGNGDWAHDYDLSHPATIFTAARMANGDYVLVGEGATASPIDTYLIRINSAGDVQWLRSFMSDPDEYNCQAVAELPNGDIMVSPGNQIANLFRMSAVGDPLGAWLSTNFSEGVSLLGLRGDSVIVEQPGFAGGPLMEPGLMIATNTGSMSCMLASTSMTETTAPTVVNVTDTLVVTSDSLRTWTMSMIQGPGPNQSDVGAFLSAGPALPVRGVLVYAAAAHMGGAMCGPITATLTFDPQLTYQNAEPPPTSVVGNTITWTGLTPLAADAMDRLYVDLDIPASMPLGTSLTESVTFSQDSTELSTSNNSATFTHVVVGSYDPNDKFVRPLDYYNLQTDTVLDYSIAFQNTGTDTAYTVVVRDTLPLDLDARTFQPGVSSHPYTYSLTGNGILTFTFDNILLPDSNINEPLSHGLINFRIKPILPLMLGTTISNVADILFDSNAPVRTPAATVVVSDALGMAKPTTPEKLGLFPVPAKDLLNVILPPKFTVRNAYIVGVDGRHVPIPMALGVQERMSVPVQHLASGAYVITVIGADGHRLAARFTKE